MTHKKGILMVNWTKDIVLNPITAYENPNPYSNCDDQSHFKELGRIVLLQSR